MRVIRESAINPFIGTRTGNALRNHGITQEPQDLQVRNCGVRFLFDFTTTWAREMIERELSRCQYRYTIE